MPGRASSEPRINNFVHSAYNKLSTESRVKFTHQTKSGAFYGSCPCVVRILRGYNNSNWIVRSRPIKWNYVFRTLYPVHLAAKPTLSIMPLRPLSLGGERSWVVPNGLFCGDRPMLLLTILKQIFTINKWDWHWRSLLLPYRRYKQLGLIRICVQLCIGNKCEVGVRKWLQGE